MQVTDATGDGPQVSEAAGLQDNLMQPDRILGPALTRELTGGTDDCREPSPTAKGTLQLADTTMHGGRDSATLTLTVTLEGQLESTVSAFVSSFID